MIISRKRFEEKVYERAADERRRDEFYRMQERIDELEIGVKNLRAQVRDLEHRLTIPQTQPYIVKPSWTGTDPVDHTPYSAWGGNSTTGGDSPC